MSTVQKRTWRRILRTLHLWIALMLCAPLVVLGITGSMLVIEHARDTTPARSTTGAAEPNVDAIVAAARAAAPADAAPSLYLAPTDDTHAATVRFAPRRATGAFQVFVDPASLAILGARPLDSGLMRRVFQLHANLMTDDRSGRTVVGWLGVSMLCLGVSGLALWWPRAGQWRSAFGVRQRARGFQLFRELHGAVGIWGLSAFVIVSASGTVLAFPQTIGGALARVLPMRDLRAVPTIARGVDAGRPVEINAAIGTARAAVPDTTVRMAGLPTRGDQPVRVVLAHSGDRPGQPPITVFVDPYRARVIELRDPTSYTTAETALAWQHALHSGQGLGWLWRALVFLCGLLPAVFATSGIAMWLSERRTRRQALGRRLVAANPAE